MGEAKRRGDFNIRKEKAIQKEIENQAILVQKKEKERMQRLEEEQALLDSMSKEEQLAYLENNQIENDKRKRQKLLLASALGIALTNNR